MPSSKKYDAWERLYKSGIFFVLKLSGKDSLIQVKIGLIA